MPLKKRTAPLNTANAGWFVAGVLAVVVLGGIYLYSDGYFDQSDDVTIELKLPGIKLDQ